MAIAVGIHPSSSSVSMFNDPETSAAYSLSGHVSVSLSSSASFFDKARPVKVLLRSLKLTFEGHSELITDETGYSAARLCSMSRELAPAQAMLITNDGHEDGGNPCTWNFVFDLPIPGWLPSSSLYGSNVHGPAGTRYALFAEASFMLVGGEHTWSLSSFCVPFGQRQRTVNAPRADIKIVRYALPPISDDSGTAMCFSDKSYTFKMHYDRDPEKPGDSSRIPQDILSKIEVIAMVSECIGLNDKALFLTLRLRAGELSEEQQRRLRLTGIRVLLSQHELYSRRPVHSYVSEFPLPPSQPDSKPLLNPHDMKALFDLGLMSNLDSVDGDAPKVYSAFNLIPKGQFRRHLLPDGGIYFAKEVSRTNKCGWCRAEVGVPFEYILPGEDLEWEEKHRRVKALRPSEGSPLFVVHHELDIELTCTYDAEEDGNLPSTSHLLFSVPIKFARLPPARTTGASLASSISSLDLAERSTLSLASSSRPVTSARQEPFSLPPYSQLFHSNGTRKLDDSIPLPVYTPRNEPNHTTDVSARDKL